jgi:hypothetical protein
MDLEGGFLWVFKGYGSNNSVVSTKENLSLFKYWKVELASASDTLASQFRHRRYVQRLRNTSGKIQQII